jgi:REP element-mobilizing transposase RayT
VSRPLRIEYPGAVYHVTARGNAREAIFNDDSDRKTFLGVLGKIIERYNWLCHAYCLMGNHYHLLIETPDGNLSRGMRQLNGIYTQTFNRRHRRVGHVLQGRFKAILVEKDSYLLELCRYIVLNPVRANRVKHPKHYAWSSYRATAGVSNPPGLPDAGMAAQPVRPATSCGRKPLSPVRRRGQRSGFPLGQAYRPDSVGIGGVREEAGEQTQSR